MCQLLLNTCVSIAKCQVIQCDVWQQAELLLHVLLCGLQLPSEALWQLPHLKVTARGCRAEGSFFSLTIYLCAISHRSGHVFTLPPCWAAEGQVHDCEWGQLPKSSWYWPHMAFPIYRSSPCPIREGTFMKHTSQWKIKYHIVVTG